jgi:hypothetical protein
LVIGTLLPWELEVVLIVCLWRGKMGGQSRETADADPGLADACALAVSKYMFLTHLDMAAIRARLVRLDGPSYILVVRSMQVALNMAVEGTKDHDDVSDMSHKNEVTHFQLSQAFAQLEANHGTTISPDRGFRGGVIQVRHGDGLEDKTVGENNKKKTALALCRVALLPCLLTLQQQLPRSK